MKVAQAAETRFYDNGEKVGELATNFEAVSCSKVGRRSNKAGDLTKQLRQRNHIGNY